MALAPAPQAAVEVEAAFWDANAEDNEPCEGLQMLPWTPAPPMSPTHGAVSLADEQAQLAALLEDVEMASADMIPAVPSGNLVVEGVDGGATEDEDDDDGESNQTGGANDTNMETF